MTTAHDPEEALAHSLAGAHVLHKDGYPYLVHPLLDGVPRVPAWMLEAWLDWASPQPVLDAATVLVAPEAMALPLAATLSLESGIPYVVARKRAYGMPGERTAVASTAYGAATFHLNDLGAHDRVVVIDDVLSTGATMRAILAAVREAGADALGALVAVDKSEGLAGDLGVQAMHRVRVHDDGVEVS